MITKANPLVLRLNGRREWGLYHHIADDELDLIASVISGGTDTWGRECATHNINCGRVYTIRNKGIGSLTITQQFWGPFRM